MCDYILKKLKKYNSSQTYKIKVIPKKFIKAIKCTRIAKFQGLWEVLGLTAVAQDVDYWEHALGKTRPFLTLLQLPETTVSGTLQAVDLAKSCRPAPICPALFLLTAQILVSAPCPRKLTFNPHEFSGAIPSTVTKTPVSAVSGDKMIRQ